MIIEHGNWCKKYQQYIENNIKQKCQNFRNEIFKGCAGSKCVHITVKTIIK